MKGLELLIHLLSLKCKLGNAKTVGRGTTTIERKSWIDHSVDFGLFTLVIYKDIHAMVFTLWGQRTFISKTSLKCSKTNTLCLNASRSLSFVYIILIFSPQITVLQPPTVCSDLCTPRTWRGTLTIWDISNR